MARRIEVEIIGDASSLEKAFKKSSRASKGFQGDMEKSSRRSQRSFGLLGKGVGALGLAFSGAAVVGGIKSSINAARDLSESVNAVNVVFGDASKTITDFSEKALQEAGLSMREFNQLATPLGAMLRNTGDGAEEAADKTIILAKRAADMASVFNTDVTTAMEAIQSALRGEADPIEKYGIKLSEAQVKAEAMALGLGKGTAQLTEAAKAQARYSLILKQSNRYAGDFRNTSGGLANQQRILRAALENLSAKLGTALLPIITKVTTALAKWLSNTKNQKTVMDTLNAVIGAVTIAANALRGAFAALNAITGSTKNTVKLLLAAFVAFKALKLITYIAGMAKAMRGFAAASAAANVAGAGGAGGGKAGKLGKLGRLGRWGPWAIPVAATALTAKMAAPYVRDWRHAKPSPATAARVRARNQVHVTVGVDRQANLVPRLEGAMTKRSRGRPRRRRGAR